MLLSKIVKCQIVITALFCAAAAHADIISVTVANATYQGTCMGGSGTCSEVINGSLLLNTSTLTATNVSLALTGSLNSTLGVVPALTPTNFGSGSSLTLPTGCGGDVANCDATGTFPSSATTPYQLLERWCIQCQHDAHECYRSPSPPVQPGRAIARAASY